MYFARHALLKRPTAIKILKPHMTTDEILARFRREVEFAAQFSHSNNIEIDDYGRTRDGVFYYAMGYPGRNHARRACRASRSVPPARTIDILRVLCAALKEVHDRGSIHRDIRPENIMLCRRGGEHEVVKVFDFAIVKNSTAASRAISRGSCACSARRNAWRPSGWVTRPTYMRAPTSGRGAGTYFLFTDSRPFAGGTDEELAQRIAHLPADHPSRILGSPLPRERQALVLGCLAKDRGAWPRNARQMMARLEEWAHWS